MLERRPKNPLGQGGCHTQGGVGERHAQDVGGGHQRGATQPPLGLVGEEADGNGNDGIDAGRGVQGQSRQKHQPQGHQQAVASDGCRQRVLSLGAGEFLKRCRRSRFGVGGLRGGLRWSKQFLVDRFGSGAGFKDLEGDREWKADRSQALVVAAGLDRHLAAHHHRLGIIDSGNVSSGGNDDPALVNVQGLPGGELEGEPNGFGVVGLGHPYGFGGLKGQAGGNQVVQGGNVGVDVITRLNGQHNGDLKGVSGSYAIHGGESLEADDLPAALGQKVRLSQGQAKQKPADPA